MSGLPQLQVCLLRLKTLSKLTGFSFQPVVTAETSSYNPAMRATCPGRDSVGTRVCETPKVPCSRTRDRRKGASGRGFSASSLEALGSGEGSGNDWKALSARKPSPGVHSQKPHKTVIHITARSTHQQTGPISLQVPLPSPHQKPSSRAQ